MPSPAPTIGEPSKPSGEDFRLMRLALRLARHAYGQTSPNPMVGAVLVKNGTIIGQGWHHRAGQPHAEIEALRQAQGQRRRIAGSTLYVTLEPCCTQGRTPACTEAIIRAGIRRVVVASADPNPLHAGRGFEIISRAGIELIHGVLGQAAAELNEAFNHWIVHRTPFVTVKAAMTLDGKVATSTGESKWITGRKARACGMKLRQGADAILVGINTILADNPSLTFRPRRGPSAIGKDRRRVILDTKARTPLSAKVVSDAFVQQTTIVVGNGAPKKQVTALAKRVDLWMAPSREGKINLDWLLEKLGGAGVTHLLVEGGGEVNASFLEGRHAHRVAFFYAPKVLGGREARKAVAGEGVRSVSDAVLLHDVVWRRLGTDWLLSARIK